MNGFRILVADNHPIFRFGVCAVLKAHEGWQVCGEAATGRDAVEKCKRLKPDLLILDICMPELNGLDAARQIMKDTPTQRILILTNVASEEVVRGCLEAGVRGWVSKSEGTDDVITAVAAMQQHKSIFSPRVSDLIMCSYGRRHVGPVAPGISKLSPREREVVQLLSEGRTSKEVATILMVSTKTAETHRSNIMRKLGIHTIAELVLYAIRNEIIHIERPPVLSFPQTGNGNAASQIAN